MRSNPPSRTHSPATTASLACAQTRSTNMDSDAFAGFYERSARPLWALPAATSGGTRPGRRPRPGKLHPLPGRRRPHRRRSRQPPLPLFRIGTNLCATTGAAPATPRSKKSPSSSASPPTPPPNPTLKSPSGPPLASSARAPASYFGWRMPRATPRGDRGHHRPRLRQHPPPALPRPPPDGPPPQAQSESNRQEDAMKMTLASPHLPPPSRSEEPA